MLRLERKYRPRTKLIFAGMGMRPRPCTPAASSMRTHQERAELNSDLGPRYVNHTSECQIVNAGCATWAMSREEHFEEYRSRQSRPQIGTTA
ncbi:hypothetical protein CBOM_07465 [Ceraceosorus bombacis]|uniref:Uncharacterized protein n=1 Tax=Ceraceosorus bombacis TaxID=401625 RepID=A0A0P1BCF6_9BASI|nr:hypothetical protein CBOM_07465 [Ceraceosorus bombacis]